MLVRVLTARRKEFKHTPDLESGGKFIREEITLHRQNAVSSQRQRMRETPGVQEIQFKMFSFPRMGIQH